ncbi:MAG: HAD-IC family P-type ATPase [Alphaproteobacteria bacterium]|nr:HAD-IC family P-type ATPase [Alphaproteobacteria bacterium]
MSETAPTLAGEKAAEDDGRSVAWHSFTPEAVALRLRSGLDGLAEPEAEARLGRLGPNRLPEAPREPALLRLARQFHNLLIYVLFAAAAISLGLGHVVDAGVILAVVILNALIGFAQEGRAERALDAIRRMIDAQATVRRGGQRLRIPAEALVPGDLVLLQAGDRVPADLRLTRASGLRLSEAALTGESVPAEKALPPVDAGALLGDRTCMAYSGTFVVGGQGAGLVVATGGATELGHISSLVSAVPDLKTPLVRQMDRFARHLTAIVGIAALAVFAFAVLVRDYAPDAAFMVVVGLAVSAIPEGLPAVMTITLAIGVQRMARRNAIIRRFQAVETLGAVSVICTDKTGTLTRNEMSVRCLLTPRHRVEVLGTGYGREGGFTAEGRPIDPLAEEELRQLIEAGALCNDADLIERDGAVAVDGDPMEGALLALAAKAGLDRGHVEAAAPRLADIPFEPTHKFMATLHGGAGTPLPRAVIKGAPERVIALCQGGGGRLPPPPPGSASWAEAIDALGRDGLRVIALAERSLEAGRRELSLGTLGAPARLIGLVGLIDPPRDDTPAALAAAREAGIEVKMITGDHEATAAAIAGQIGLAPAIRVVSGHALETLDAAGLRSAAREGNVFARTTPEHKLRLVEALQAEGRVVAMTGDGVNDAPALRRADVGVAMGRSGTETAKEAARMVLVDDTFATIMEAVREGRTVYDNIRKLIGWTLPTSMGECLAIIAALAFGLILPITPVQILWINLVTAVALGTTIAFEPTEPGTMRRPPRDPAEPLLTMELWWQVGFVSVMFVIVVFGLFLAALDAGRSVAEARTIAVNMLVVAEIAYLFSIRFVYGPSLTLRGVLGTPAVLIGLGFSILAQLAITYVPFMQTAFGTAALGLRDGASILVGGAFLLAVFEAEKLLRRWLTRRRARHPSA